MRKFRVAAVLLAAVAVLGIGVGPASAKPYHFKAGQAVEVTTAR